MKSTHAPIRGKWLLAGGVAVLLAVAAGALALRGRASHIPPKPPAPKPEIVGEVGLSGRIEARHTVPVAASMEGVLETFAAEIGQEVAAGQLLARIANGKLQSTLDAASLELERARTRITNLEGAILTARLEESRAEADASRARGESERAAKAFVRQEMLMREGATPRLVFEKAQKESETLDADARSRAELAKQAEARLAALTKDLEAAQRVEDEKSKDAEGAGADLASSEVRAPVDGIVISRRVQAGDPVDRTMGDLFQIAVDLTTLQVRADAPPNMAARIRAGQPALIQVAELPGEGLMGTVSGLKDGQVLVEFISPSNVIRPGLTAQVRIKLT